MPYKEKAMKSQRQKERRKGEAPIEMKPLNEALTEMVKASYVEGIDGRKYQERPRYLELSDGQRLDRLNQPVAVASGDMMVRMRRSNEAFYNFIPRGDRLRARKVLSEALQSKSRGIGE